MTTGQLQLIATVSVVLAPCLLAARWGGYLKIDWSWVVAFTITLLVIGIFALMLSMSEL